MNVSKIAILAALGTIAVTGGANATCSPTLAPIADGISVDVSGCHLQVHNPAVIPTQTGMGIEVIVRDPLTGEVGSDGGNITGELDRQIAHDAEQDDRLDKQKAAIKANYAWDKKQQKQINHLKNENGAQWDAIGSLEQTTAEHTDTLNAHSALLSDHATQLGKIHGRLDEQSKGIAIATAMPDAWLSDKESFAIAGGIGGFGDETALGFIAIGRIDQTWSVNAGLGSDTEFKEFGWKAGVRAGW